MPVLRRKIAAAENVIFESNRVVKFVMPDLYFIVLDPATPDFKLSAREFIDQADALVLHRVQVEGTKWQGVSLKPAARKPVFFIQPPSYVTAEMVDFVRARLLAGTR